MGTITVYFVDGSKSILPNSDEKYFQTFVDFFKNEEKTNLVVEANNGSILYLKDKIINVTYIKDKENE